MSFPASRRHIDGVDEDASGGKRLGTTLPRGEARAGKNEFIGTTLRDRLAPSKPICRRKTARKRGPARNGFGRLADSASTSIQSKRCGMKSKLAAPFGLIVGLLIVCAPMFAHHGGSDYDTQNLLTLKGTVTEFSSVQPSLSGLCRRQR